MNWWLLWALVGLPVALRILEPVLDTYERQRRSESGLRWWWHWRWWLL